MEKCQSAGREAQGCKLPTEADRPELLRSAPRQLAIALLYWRLNPWSIYLFSPPPSWFLFFSPPAARARVVGAQGGVSESLPVS